MHSFTSSGGFDVALFALIHMKLFALIHYSLSFTIRSHSHETMLFALIHMHSFTSSGGFMRTSGSPRCHALSFIWVLRRCVCHSFSFTWIRQCATSSDGYQTTWDVVLCEPWLIHVCDVVWWLSDDMRRRVMRTMTHSCVWRRLMAIRRSQRTFTWDVFSCERWLIHVCDVTHSCAWRDAFMCVTWRIHVKDDSFMCVTWRIHVWNDSFMCATWRNAPWDDIAHCSFHVKESEWHTSMCGTLRGDLARCHMAHCPMSFTWDNVPCDNVPRSHGTMSHDTMCLVHMGQCAMRQCAVRCGTLSHGTWSHVNEAHCHMAHCPMWTSGTSRCACPSAGGVKRLKIGGGDLIQTKPVFWIFRCQSIWVRISAIIRVPEYFFE